MKTRKQVMFWVIVYAVLILLFGNALKGYLYSVYFVSLLLPIIIGTSYLFNYYLVPKYLMAKKYGKFTLYFSYSLIISLYLEIVVIFLAFIYLANYKITDLNPTIRNVWTLTITLYAIVFIKGFILLFQKFQKSENVIQGLEEENTKNEKGYLIVKSERKNIRILFDEILYVESLADYVKIHVSSSIPIVTKQKISHIQSELTSDFIRIHRSFIVNKSNLTSFNADHVLIDKEKLPISRTYKKKVKMELN